MALKGITPLFMSPADTLQLEADNLRSFSLPEHEIPANVLFRPVDSEKRTAAGPASDSLAQCRCTHCGEMHELKEKLWLVENARLVEVNVSGFFYCAEVNKVIISGA